MAIEVNRETLAVQYARLCASGDVRDMRDSFGLRATWAEYLSMFDYHLAYQLARPFEGDEACPETERSAA